MVSIHLDDQINEQPNSHIQVRDFIPQNKHNNHNAEQCPIDSHSRLCVKLTNLGSLEFGRLGQGITLVGLLVSRWLFGHDGSLY